MAQPGIGGDSDRVALKVGVAEAERRRVLEVELCADLLAEGCEGERRVVGMKASRRFVLDLDAAAEAS